MKKETNVKLNSEEFYASRPLKIVKFMRRCIPYQLWKFLIINLKVMRIVAYGHS